MPVRLHDADFERLSYELRPRPTLLLRFNYDAEWTPQEAVPTPIIAFRFRDVLVEAWEDDAEALAEPSAWHGEVKVFDYFAADRFDLQTSTLRLTFRAAEATVSLHAA